MIQCRDCVCWVQTEGHEVGECHRFAPRPAVGGSGPKDAVWGDVYAEEGCYEGVPKPQRMDATSDIDLRATIERILAAPHVRITSARACTVLHNAELRGTRVTPNDLRWLPNCGPVTEKFILRFAVLKPTKEG